jgi:hypothetical protein
MCATGSSMMIMIMYGDEDDGDDDGCRRSIKINFTILWMMMTTTNNRFSVNT